MRRLVAVLVFVAMSAVTTSPVHAQNIWRELREESGLVILMRHAIAPGGGDPAGFRLGDCSTQRNLSAEGRAQARAIGERLRQERVPIAGVLNSRWCRAAQTARLLNVGKPRASAALDSVFTAATPTALRKQRQAEGIIQRHRGKPGVLVLVGHQANIIDLTGIAPASGGAVVVRADRNGRVRIVGQVLPP